MTVIQSLALRTDLDETAGIANVAYNGFRFPPGRHASVSFSPEMSDDGRTTKYLRMDIRIEFIWLPMDWVDAHQDENQSGFDNSGVTDTNFPALRQRLTAPGQALRFWSQGIGLFSVQEANRFDVNNGPKPRVVSEAPIAGSKALRVIWECSTWVPNCILNTGLNGIAQFLYGVTWNIGTNGVTTRSISGSIEIPLSRVPAPGQPISETASLRSNADEVREQVMGHFPKVLGFERAYSFSLSNDRKTLSFTISDMEINSQNPYFPGIVRMSVQRRYNSDYKTGFTKWSGTVSGSIEVAPGYSKLRGWIAYASVFDDIFSKRELGHLPKTATTSPSKSGTTTPLGKPSWGMLTSISLEEEIYGRTMSFSIGYHLFCSLSELFKATGLFQPLTISPSDASWNLWRTSMSQIQGGRGWRGLNYATSDDIIIDLCSGLTQLPTRQESNTFPSETTVLGDGKTPPGPPADKSYIHYDSKITSEADDGSSHALPLQKSLPVNESTSLTAPNVDGTTFGTAESSGLVPSHPVITRTRPTRYLITFEGSSARVGYLPPVPNLKSVGGKKAYKIGRDQIVSKIVGSGTDVASGAPLTIYGLYWRKQYILEDRPSTGIIDWEGEPSIYT